jgi:rhodanese-related sulfurtransferase
MAGLALGAGTAQSQSLGESIAKYKQRYPLVDPLQKLIGPHGKVPDGISGVDKDKLASELKGVRNFRVVLGGLMYRGGKIHPLDGKKNPDDGKKDNHYPLPDYGLKNLCEQGFGEAVYLYASRMSEKQIEKSCISGGASNVLTYRKLPPLNSEANATEILKIMHRRLTGADNRPVYVHCWNGWHASGYISALALRQFCGVSLEQAIAYWDLNTDHVCGSSYEHVREKIRAFKMKPELEVGEEIKGLICPTMSFKVDEKKWCTINS